MKIRSVEDIELFKAALDKCEGRVWLESVYGDRYNLKSTLSQYVALGALLRDKNEELELFASDKKDEAILMQFMQELEERHAA